MTAYDFGWRDRVADPDWLRFCRCRHAEQVHDITGCTAGPYGHRCPCGSFTEARKEWVGPASERPT